MQNQRAPVCKETNSSHYIKILTPLVREVTDEEKV
jgi:hypothetical protein